MEDNDSCRIMLIKLNSINRNTAENEKVNSNPKLMMHYCFVKGKVS